MLFRLAALFCFILFATHANENRIMGVGPAPIDLLIQVSDDFLKEHILHRKGGDCQCEPDTIQRILAISGKEPKIVAGGSTANTIRALAKLGEKCVFFGQVGNDPYGEEFCRDLSMSGVEAQIAKIPDMTTCHVLCMISPEGQRTFLGFDPGLDEKIVPTQNDFKNVQWLHMEARHFDHGDMAMKVFQMARESGVKASIDLSAMEVIDRHRGKITEALSKYVDIVFCNEDEILEMTGLPPEAGALKLQELCPVVVVTLGNKGCIVGYGKKVVHVPGFAANVIDTTGAGDFFAAGFLYGYLQGKSMEIAAKIGHHLGSAIVEVIGAQLPEEHWNKTRAAVAKYF